MYLALNFHLRILRDHNGIEVEPPLSFPIIVRVALWSVVILLFGLNVNENPTSVVAISLDVSPKKIEAVCDESTSNPVPVNVPTFLFDKTGYILKSYYIQVRWLGWY